MKFLNKVTANAHDLVSLLEKEWKSGNILKARANAWLERFTDCSEPGSEQDHFESLFPDECLDDVDVESKDFLQKIMDQLVTYNEDSSFTNFIKHLKKYAKFEIGGIILWRAIEAKTINYNSLGVFWAYRKEDARAIWGGRGEPTVIKCLAPFSSIDLAGTIAAHCLYGESESEIRLKERGPITVDGKKTFAMVRR